MKRSLLLIFISLFLYQCKSDEEVETDNNNTSKILKDVDGNVYKTVTIGTQTWMAENLKTTKYNDGTDIPLDTAWENLRSSRYCYYENDKQFNAYSLEEDGTMGELVGTWGQTKTGRKKLLK